MKKLFSLLLLTALVISACSSSGQVAASVDGSNITVNQVEENIDPTESTIPVEQFAQFLGFEIQWEITGAAATAEWGIEISEDEIMIEADRIYEAANEGETREVFLSSRGVTELFLSKIAEQGLLDLAIRDELAPEAEDPTQEAIDAEAARSRAGLTEVCVSHILVPVEDEAVDAMSRLDEGEDFATVATELSQDPGSAANGGVLPCSSAAQYVESFRDASLVAPVGQVYEEIVESNFGFHILLVTQRIEPDEGQLPSTQEITDSLKAQSVGLLLNAWFTEQLEAAEVIVEEQYGTWQTTPNPTVIPPAT